LFLSANHHFITYQAQHLAQELNHSFSHKTHSFAQQSVQNSTVQWHNQDFYRRKVPVSGDLPNDLLKSHQ